MKRPSSRGKAGRQSSRMEEADPGELNKTFSTEDDEKEDSAKDEAKEDSDDDEIMKEDDDDEKMENDNDDEVQDGEKEMEMSVSTSKEEGGILAKVGGEEEVVDYERSEFLDAFYNLASTDSPERSRAGQVILHHSILSPQKANVADACYVLKRLLNGLCSGRAAARQGSASTLASFLKVAKMHGYLTKIHQYQENNKENKKLGLISYIRSRLVQASSLEQGNGGGRLKASQIKDHQWGRLFGILAIVRSGILLPDSDGDGGDESDKHDRMDASKALLSDLQELYHKPFMREPASHAVCSLLNSFLVGGSTTTCPSNKKAGIKIACKLVEESVIPLFLKKGDMAKDTDTSEMSLNSLSAEQIAMVLNIQSFGDAFPAKVLKKMGIIKDPILTPDNLPGLAEILADTTSVNHPRMHVVWDALWLYLTEPYSPQNSRDHTKGNNNEHGDEKASPVDSRVLRSKLPVVHGKGGSSARGVVKSILDEVLIQKLLTVSENDNDDGENGSDEAFTHPSKSEMTSRKVMALNLVQIMAGVEFVSSLSGRTILTLDSDEHLFQGTVVRKLFLDVLLGSGVLSGKKRKKGHQGEVQQINTLARDCLKNIVDSLTTTATAQSAKLEARRILILKCFVRCDARFDIRTKTTVIQDLLGLTVGGEKDVPEKLWTEFIAFAQDRILKVSDRETAEGHDGNDSSFISCSEAGGLLDHLFRLSKHIIRMEAPQGYSQAQVSSMREFKEATTRQILSFLAAASFVRPNSDESERKADTNISAKADTATLAIARRVSQSHIPLDTRKSLQARLFSLLTETITSSSSAVRNPSKSSPSELREVVMLRPVQYVWEACNELRQCGFVQISPTKDEDEVIVSKTLASVNNNNKDGAEVNPSPRSRFILSMTLVESFLNLCLFSNNDPDTELGEMSGMTDINDSDEIHALFEEARECIDAVVNKDLNAQGGDGLSRLIALCLNLMLWELDESRGSAKRLVREIVKLLLTSGLMILSTSSCLQLNSKVAAMMMEAVGVTPSGDTQSQCEEDEDEESDDDDGSDDSEDLESNGLFTKSAALLHADGEDGDTLEENNEEPAPSDSEESGEKDSSEKEDKDIVIDDDRLKSMLEDDSDIDVDEKELEHHEGADAALAQLLKLKQEARKAGQLAKQRVELCQQLRCMLVLETVVNGKPETWGRLLRCDVLLSMIPSFLGRISQLDKARVVQRGKGAFDGITNERNTLLKALTNFFKTKLLKSKMWSMEWTESVVPVDYSSQVMEEVMELSQVKAATKEQKLLCYQALPVVLRCIPSYDSRIEIATSLFSAAVVEWSTRKSTNITSDLFDELLHRDIPLAQCVLVKPLSRAIPEARARFIKSECFRVLSDLYNPNINKGDTDQEKQALKNLVECRSDFLRAAVHALKDAEMLKSKGIKEMIRTMEKVIGFKSPLASLASPLPLDSLESLEDALQYASKTTESENGKQLCDAFISKVDGWKQVTAAKSPTQAPSRSSSKDNKKKAKKRKS